MDKDEINEGVMKAMENILKKDPKAFDFSLMPFCGLRFHEALKKALKDYIHNMGCKIESVHLVKKWKDFNIQKRKLRYQAMRIGDVITATNNQLLDDMTEILDRQARLNNAGKDRIFW